MQYYYVNSSSEQVGPVSVEELRKAGISRDTLVWKEGMKEWQPAGGIEELRVLFTVTPPPVHKKAPLPPPPPVAGSKPEPAKPTVQKNRNKYLIVAAGLVILIAALVFFIFQDEEPHDDIFIAADADSTALGGDDTSASDNTTRDTVNIVDIDSLRNNLKWDTVATQDTVSGDDQNVSFLPGFGAEGSTKTKKSKKPASRKTERQTVREEINDEAEDNTPAPGKREPARLNPARALSVNGSFRKNLFFEAIMEGTIKNNSGSEINEVVVEVSYLDGNGGVIGLKKFPHNASIAPGSSSTFRFKATAPKGTKSARYSIASASAG